MSPLLRFESREEENAFPWEELILPSPAWHDQLCHGDFPGSTEEFDTAVCSGLCPKVQLHPGWSCKCHCFPSVPALCAVPRDQQGQNPRAGAAASAETRLYHFIDHFQSLSEAVFGCRLTKKQELLQSVRELFQVHFPS